MILKQEILSKVISELKSQGKQIVFTNGCFDILHAGHVTYLNYCKQQGDILVVGMNSDESIKGLKGEDRPVHKEDDRARVLAALADVDFVVPFADEKALEKLIHGVQPNVLVKGADWKGKSVKGGAFVKKHGGSVMFAPLLKGRSTSSTITRMRKGQ